MDADAVKELMPWFLDQKSKSDLYESVRQLAEGGIDFDDYFVSDNAALGDDLSQGDVVEDMIIIRLPDTKSSKNLGMIISNTCSISRDNSKVLTPRIVYAPAISLDKLAKLVKVKVEDLPGFLDSIRSQRAMNAFYLPKGQYNDKERVVLFDYALSTDRKEFSVGAPDRIKIRLSRKAYYHFLIKVTAYFARTTQELVLERS